MAVMKFQGVVLKKALVAIGQMTNISHSGFAAEMMDTTHATTTDGARTHEFNGLTEPGSISATLQYDPADVAHKALIADLKAGTSGAYSIEWTDTGASTESFTATPVKFDISGSQGGMFEASIELKISGAITHPV